MALSVSAALAQIGEFSFILAGMGIAFGVLPQEASSAIIIAAIISITLNPLIYRRLEGLAHWLEKHGVGLPHTGKTELPEQVNEETQRVIVIGYGPIGKILSRFLLDNNLDVVVIEMN